MNDEVKRELEYHKAHALERAYMIGAEVLRNARGGDCTNGGASSRFATLYVYSDFISEAAALLDIEQRGLDVAQCFRVRCVECGDNRFYHVKPLDPALSGKWTMMGGNFVYTCDGRWYEVTGHHYPLPVHDRVEA